MKKGIPFIAALLCLLLLCGCGEAKRIKAEIFDYVLQNKDAIEIDPLDSYVPFYYEGTGDVTASVDYGYYYTENNDYQAYGGGSISKRSETEYKHGYRINDINNDPTDWYYTEKICDNWYYYELHDG